MSARSTLICIVLLTTVPFAAAKNKQPLSNYVLQAQTVAVVLLPDAGEPVANPTANRTAQDNVEKALLQWGRYRVIPDAQTADLVIAVRKAHAGGPTISNSPTDNRPVILQQPTPGTIRVGGQQGSPPDLTYPGPGPAGRGPSVGNEVGTSDDTFELFRGGVEYPLDSAPLWRYMAKDALDAPQLRAVEQFRKAVAESEKAQKQKP